MCYEHTDIQTAISNEEGNKNKHNNSNPNKLSLTLLIGIAFRYHRYQCFFSQNHLIPNPAHHF